MLIIRSLFACLLLTLIAACGTAGQISSPASASAVGDVAAARGMAFAQAHCAACHAIDAGISPLSHAPSFAATANTPGLSAGTLRPWLSDSHNYPDVMKFALAPERIDDLTAYMLTLKSQNYKPPIQ
jgi:mono/diheme cytochrome c family protein